MKKPPEPAAAEEKSMKMDKDTVLRHMQMYDALKTARIPWLVICEEIARYVLPQRVPGMNSTSLFPNTDAESSLFDITAVQSNMVLANGTLAWMTPQDTPWFAFVPQEGDDDELKRWLAKCTQKTRDTLGTSNFYKAIHEFYLDRSAFGIGALYVEEGKKQVLNCECWPVGTFVIDVDDEGTVDTIVRSFQFTPTQAKKKFGEENLSQKMRKALKDGGAKAMEKFEFLHFIMPRGDDERDRESLTPENMPIASFYVEVQEKHVCRVSGYPEMPVMVSRYMEWGTGTGGTYGCSPAWAALPEARQLNYLQKMMDALAEKMAFPPILAPEGLTGEIDPNAAGVTWFSSDVAGTPPREWMMGGSYDVGKDRIIERQNAVKKAFHTDLFQMYADLDKEMTAREVAGRESEKLIQSAPTFYRMTTEVYNPFLARVFGILFRAGKFGSPLEAPRAAMIPVNQAKGLYDLREPNVEYSSRIALAMRNLPTVGLWRTIELLQQALPIWPDAADNFNIDGPVVSAAINDGMAAEAIRSKTEREEIRAARAAQQEAMQQMAQAQVAGEAAKNIGSVKSDSLVGQKLAA